MHQAATNKTEARNGKNKERDWACGANLTHSRKIPIKKAQGEGKEERTPRNLEGKRKRANSKPIYAC